MTKPQVFVSHAYEDLDKIQTFLYPINYLPIELYIAVEDASTGRISDTIRREIEKSQVIVPFLTDTSVENVWVNQEIGCAVAHDLDIIPLFQQSSQLHGFISGIEGVSISYEYPHKTSYGLLTRLREIFSSLSEVSNWYLDVRCSDCNRHNMFPIEQTQAELTYIYERGDFLEYRCSDCGTTYFFHPLSLHMNETK